MVNCNPQTSRRQILTIGAGLVTVGASWVNAAAPAHAAAPRPRASPESVTTANGWPARSAPTAVLFEGTNVSAAVLGGEVAVILGHVVRRYHYEIDSLLPGEVTGHSSRAVGPQSYNTHYLSGTAVAIRAELYPAGVSGGFFPAEVAVIRDVLAECETAVRWGGDESEPKESHFHIDWGPRDPRLKRLAQKISSWDMSSSQAPGARDILEPSRLRAAEAIRRELTHEGVS